jgi:hypothetical protein
MAHFARVENTIVKEIVVISDSDAPDPAPVNSEPLGQAFIRDVLNLDGTWIQTSYNRKFRGHYAGIGYTWDETNQVFYPQKPYPSWNLNANWDWEAPIPYPSDEKIYHWNEENKEWVETILENFQINISNE